MRWPQLKWFMTLTNGEPCWQQLFCYDLMTNRKAKNKKTKPEMKSYMVVKDIRCVLKLDLWPSQGWPCGCQHDLIAWNSLHVLSWTSKKLKKHDSLINKNLDAYGRTRQTRYCDIVQYRHPTATWVDLWLSTKPLQV